jgi:hypothetical protein
MTHTAAFPTTYAEEVTQRIGRFHQRFGDAHLYLAYHAALPLALTPELLYQLWANFQYDCNGDKLGILWFAVSDVLLSGLCEEVGNELYEMDQAIREELLRQLQEHSRFGFDRVREIADFVIAYTELQLNNLDQDTRDLATAQRWSALAHKAPAQAANEIKIALLQLNPDDKSEWIRIAALLEKLKNQLSEFKPLIIYAQAMAQEARSGLSVQDSIRLLQEEQDRQNYNDQSRAIPQSWFQTVSNAKKYLFACVAILALSSAVGFSIYKSTSSSSGMFIVNSLSGKCIDVLGPPGIQNGASLVLWDCETSGLNRENGSPTDQRWTLNADGFIVNSLSGKCIDVDGAPDIQNGASLVLRDCETSGLNRENGSPTDQRWRLQ